MLVLLVCVERPVPDHSVGKVPLLVLFCVYVYNIASIIGSPVAYIKNVNKQNAIFPHLLVLIFPHFPLFLHKFVHILFDMHETMLAVFCRVLLVIWMKLIELARIWLKMKKNEERKLGECQVFVFKNLRVGY